MRLQQIPYRITHVMALLFIAHRNTSFWPIVPIIPHYSCKHYLNEIAFILKENQYGRIVWNERKKEVDTGVWYYKIHVYNLFSTISSNFKYDIFMSRTPDYEYKQLATLY